MALKLPRVKRQFIFSDPGGAGKEVQKLASRPETYIQGVRHTDPRR